MKVIILGDGGHSKVIQEMIMALGRHEIVAVLDDKYDQGFQLKGMIHAPISFLVKLLRPGIRVVVAIGDNKIRKTITENLNLLPEQFMTVIHPTAVVSSSAAIGHGTVVMPHVVVNARAEIGSHCIINSASVIEHDNEIGSFTHVSPNATFAGNVTCGEGVHAGSAATVIPDMHLGSWSIIGAGSTVIENIPAYSKAVGSPTRIIERLLI
ncbi:acetyltransferase EpsM [Lentibacillus persicus]|uniref:Acetyltransferase EpsM n=2 Tax=Lentibacillus persicus TaxID=640948 RepID=A0A1I1UCB4_9BACI|nr:acetyltransferase EpsM [Lentibacillus persicus]